MSGSDSEFLYPDLAEAVSQSIAQRVGEIMRAADAGEPPVVAVSGEVRN